MKTFSYLGGWSLAALAGLAVLGSGCERHDHGTAGGKAGGGHHHDSAHGGVAVELGDHQFHLDFVAEAATGTLKAWVMDAHAENFVRVTNLSWAVRIAAGGEEKELVLQAVANPATGEKEGDTSSFEAKAEWLKGVERFTAVVPWVQLRGQTFTNIGFSYPAH